MFEKVGKVDAVVVTAGHTNFGPVATMTPDQFRKGINDKLMGQINLVLIGLPYVNDGGSFTLTSGVLDRDVIRRGSNSAAVNGALDAFAKSAAIEMPRGIRINVVSRGLWKSQSRSMKASFWAMSRYHRPAWTLLM
ncbi:MAG: SDR family oxidoreductase [Aestuariivirga sp.]